MENTNYDQIELRGLEENNLKGVSLNVPKGKIVVFTGVSGSGKSSIVFDTIAAESQRQMNETYPAFVRMRLPKYPHPCADAIRNLTPSVVVDQSSLGGNARSTVGTITDLYSALRLLFSRVGTPCAGPSGAYSFNEPAGMCKTCTGLGMVTGIDIEKIVDRSKSFREGAIIDPCFVPGSWYWTQYINSGIFDADKPLSRFDEEEWNILFYGSRDRSDERLDPKIEGIYNRTLRLYLNRDLSGKSQHSKDRARSMMTNAECPDCHGLRLNARALESRINGKNIAELSCLEMADLRSELERIDDPRARSIVESLVSGLTRIIDIGLPYLSLNRESSSLSGGEGQRLKMVRYMGSSLTGMTYIFDEPSTGLHPRDVHRLNDLFVSLRDKGNTVLIVEHDRDVIAIADEVIDIGPKAGSAGGNVVFQGSVPGLLASGTLTGTYLRKRIPVGTSPRKAAAWFEIRDATLHNLKRVSVRIPLGIFTAVTGVAGSGKSTLVSRVFAERCPDAVLIDQKPITATGRSTPASYLGFMDEIRKLFAAANGVDAGWFSFNSLGACPACEGRGVIVTELAFMDPVTTECEACGGRRFGEKSLSYAVNGRNIQQVLDLTVSDALEFFARSTIARKLKVLDRVGLGYLTLGQPLSTLSGGERQRIKLAKNLSARGNVLILDEPTTGLHLSDIEKLLKLFRKLVDGGNTVVVIEHNLDVVKQADWIIDIGPDGGKHGGTVVFEGTPLEMIETGKGFTADYLRKDAS